MTKVKLIPVYDPQAVLKCWKHIADGLEIVLDHSGNDTSMEKVFNDLMSGRLLLWVGFVDNVYSGFVTTSFHSPSINKKFLWIVHCYKKAKVPSEFLLEGLTYLEDFARESSCSAIKFYALEKPWQNKLKALGYEPGYVEYVKPVGEKNEDLQKDHPES